MAKLHWFISLLFLSAIQQGRSNLALEPDTWSCPALGTRLEIDETEQKWLAEVDELACEAVSAGSEHHPSAISALKMLEGRGNGTEIATYRELLNAIVEEGDLGLERERDRLGRALLVASTVSDAHPYHTWQANVRVAVLRRISCEIPNIVHFIKTDSRPDNFKIVHFLSVKSAVSNMRPEAVYFYSPTEPTGYWWDKIRPHVTFVQTQAPSHLSNGKQLYYAAHQSDVMRFQILLLKGGIYMDWDVIALRPFLPLLRQRKAVVLGEEKRVPGYEYAISNAIIAARPRAPLLRQWLSEFPMVFDAGCYTCHSVLHAPRMAARMPDQVKVMPWTTFCYPGWEKEPVDAVFAPNQPRDMDLDKGYAIHLFESHANMVPHIEKLSEEYIRTVDTNFNLIVRPLLD